MSSAASGPLTFQRRFRPNQAALSRVRACMRARARPAAPSSKLPDMNRVPRLDSLPPSPIDWHDVPLGAGQEPNGLCHDGAFQYTQDQYGVNPVGADVRRNPGESWQIISRVPERP